MPFPPAANADELVGQDSRWPHDSPLMGMRKPPPSEGWGLLRLARGTASRSLDGEHQHH